MFITIDHDWLVGNVSKRYGGSKDMTTGEDGSIQVLEPRKVKGSVSGDAFFVMTPPWYKLEGAFKVTNILGTAV